MSGSSGIDFVVGAPEPADDEVLPDPRRRPGLWWAALGLVCAAVVAVLVRQRSTPRPLPALPSPSVEARPAAPSGVTVQQALAQAELLPACPRAGDGQSACVTDSTVPATVRAAVRAAFPRSGTVSGVTQLLRDTGPTSVHGLWSRRLTDHAGLVVLVRRAEAGEVTVGADVTVDRRGTLTYLQQRIGGYLVTAQVRGPVGSAPLPGEVFRLASDKRVLAVSR